MTYLDKIGSIVQFLNLGSHKFELSYCVPEIIPEEIFPVRDWTWARQDTSARYPSVDTPI